MQWLIFSHSHIIANVDKYFDHFKFYPRDGIFCPPPPDKIFCLGSKYTRCSICTSSRKVAFLHRIFILIYTVVCRDIGAHMDVVVSVRSCRSDSVSACQFCMNQRSSKGYIYLWFVGMLLTGELLLFWSPWPDSLTSNTSSYFIVPEKSVLIPCKHQLNPVP